jgi:hypothetical protein
MRRARRGWVTFVVAGMAAVLVSCNENAVGPPEPPDFVGVVPSDPVAEPEAVTPTSFRLQVTAARWRTPPPGRVIVHVWPPPRSRIHLVGGGEFPAVGSVADLPGATVRIWTTGLELRSGILQYYAERIEVVRGSSRR